MKKLVLAALLSVAGVGLSAGQASAWLFCHHCCRSCATICVRPYNAFSPSVFGSICADGCFPLQGCNQGCAPPGYGGPGGPMPPWFGGGAMGCADGGCMSGGCLSGPGQSTVMADPALGGAPNAQLPTSAPPMMLPPGSVPTSQPPTPAPMPNGPAAPNTGAMLYPSGVQSAAYYGYAAPGYYPGYAPRPYPGYWNMSNMYGR